MSGHDCNQTPLLESLLTGQQQIHETLFELGQAMVQLASVQKEQDSLRADHQELMARVDKLEKKDGEKALKMVTNIEAWAMRALVLWMANEFFGII